MVATELGGVTVGLANPWFLAALPVAVAALWLLAFRGDGTASARSRRLLFAARLLTVVLVVTAAAGPYTVQTKETRGDPRVTLLVDRSNSMNVMSGAGETLAQNIEDEGVPVTTATVASGNESRIGDNVAANLRENGSVVVLSDGQVTGGRSLQDVTELATSVNATVSSVNVNPRRTERYVTLNGPSKTSVGVEATFLARVGGVETEGETTLSVRVDGQEVLTRTLENGAGNTEFSHTFNETGSHRVTATVSSDDAFATNDVYRRTVRVVDRPKILYVSRGDYPFRSYLEQIYDVDTAESVPSSSNLSQYYAVVMQDVAAQDAGNVDALQRFVIDGGGLMVVGGDNSFENGGYNNSDISSMLPVSVGESAGGSSNIVFAIDVSGSSKNGMKVQKALALDALEQLGGDNEVGIVGFNWQAYRVADVQPLSDNRGELKDKIRRLQSGGATDIAAGLRGAGDMLGDRQGTIILISDGHDDIGRPAAVATSLGAQGVNVITIGAGQNPNENVLQTIAQESGGNYFRATETNRLRLLFGGSSRRYEGDGLTIVNQNSFVTSGVTLESSPAAANDVSVKRGAEFLVANSEGKPAVASWRYGLGRVVTITAYGDDGSLDGLLQRPDSLLLTKSTNYVIGDPERKATDITEVPDTRVRTPTTVVYRGPDRPTVDGLSFSKVDENRYEATVVPERIGYHTVLNSSYAANYPQEYEALGTSSSLRALVNATGGRQFSTGQAAQIAEFAREQSVRVRDVRTDWTWALLLLSFVVFLIEVLSRRIQVYRGRTRNEGGLS